MIRLSELSRVESELQEELTRLASRLREQLLPQGLRRRRIATVLRTHRIRRVTAEAVEAQLRAPARRVAPGPAAAAGEHIAWLLPRLRLVHGQRQQCARRLDGVLDTLTAADLEAPSEQRDVAILRSLPGVGRVVAATLLAEAAPALANRDYHALRGQVSK